jgi:hydrogenase maturation protease
MRADAPSTAARSLVIGYGNTLRSDDGAGVRVAEAVAAWDRPGVAALSVPQLVPEIAARLADVDLVVFVDARLARVGDAITISRIRPAPSIRPAGHIGDPRSLLALTEMLFGRCPHAWLIGVPAVELSIGEDLSATAAGGIRAACDRIRRMIPGGFADRDAARRL